MKQLLLAVFGIISTLSLHPSAGYASDITYGPEFEFRNEAMTAELSEFDGFTISRPASIEAQEAFATAVMANCPDCAMEVIDDKYGIETYRFHTPEGFNFTISLDPAVVEVQMSPLTLKEIKRYKSKIQKYIFDSANEVALPAARESGHLHFGLNAFENDPKLFRNFVVDWVNNSEITTVVYGRSALNAPTLAELKADQQQKYLEIIEAFDSVLNEQSAPQKSFFERMKSKFIRKTDFVKYFENNKSDLVTALKSAIREHVYYATPRKADPADKYQNLNMNHPNTIEFRNINGQASAEDFMLMSEFVERKIKVLKSEDRLIEAKIPSRLNYVHEAAPKFALFATETGMSADNIRKLAPEFVRKQMTNNMVCREIFKN